MTEFNGFPAKMQFTPVPNMVFSSLLPQITDLNELKTLLYIFQLRYMKKGSLRFVAQSELAGLPGLLSGFGGPDPAAALRTVLDTLERKNIILHLRMRRAEAEHDLYFVNDEEGRTATGKISSGDVEILGFEPSLPAETAAGPPQDIFTLYEQNIGMLTPLIADELREAGKQYSENWIREAIKEAAALNRRNWRYIARILEHWATEGKDDGTHRRNTAQNSDPDKYIRGRYGHMVQR
jgi:DNA replication protein